jgi:hypothetical protein
LQEAVEIYRQAGRHALQQQAASGWWQLYIQFTDWNAADQTAADHLAPMLADTTPDGPLLRADGPLAPAAGGAEAFRRTGRTLGSTARFARWLDTYGCCYWTTHAQLSAPPPPEPQPARQSWCYGQPGIARAQQLAALALSDPARRLAAEDTVLRTLTDPVHLGRISDASLCHGWAGLVAIARAVADDSSAPDRFTSLLEDLNKRLATDLDRLPKPAVSPEAAQALSSALHEQRFHFLRKDGGLRLRTERTATDLLDGLVADGHANGLGRRHLRAGDRGIRRTRRHGRRARRVLRGQPRRPRRDRQPQRQRALRPVALRDDRLGRTGPVRGR